MGHPNHPNELLEGQIPSSNLLQILVFEDYATLLSLLDNHEIGDVWSNFLSQSKLSQFWMNIHFSNGEDPLVIPVYQNDIFVPTVIFVQSNRVRNFQGFCHE